MTESSINEQGSLEQGDTRRRVWAIVGASSGTWWNGLIFMSTHFAHSILRTSFSLQEIPLLNCYKPPEFLPLAS